MPNECGPGRSTPFWRKYRRPCPRAARSTSAAGRAGTDVIWLAANGWHATGLDISNTAIRRAREAARAAGVPLGRAEFRVADITNLRTDQRYDLISASFLHSPVELARGHILRRAARHVAPSGHLLITSHAVPPPWAGAQLESGFNTPENEIAMLDLDEAEWTTEIAQLREREATSRNGETATLTDSIVLLRRRRRTRSTPRRRDSGP